MANLGGWEIKVAVDAAPQKVATAIGELNELVGADYTPIAYLGSQLVNGTNHAVLAKQKLVLGEDVENIVVVIFHETKEGVTVSSIERIVEGGGKLGGIKIADDPKVITDEAQKAFDEVFTGFCGSDVKPFALLGTQVTKGVDYIFAAEVTSVTENPVTTVDVVTINSMTKNISFINMLANKNDVNNLGYAFTWLKKSSLGAPLGEWP